MTIFVIVTIFLFAFDPACSNEKVRRIFGDVQSKKHCVNLTLNASEYDVTRDGELKTIYSDWIVNDFQLDGEDDSVTFCFPFSDRFQRCLGKTVKDSDYPLTWQLREGEIRWINDSLDFQDLVHDVEYKLGDYEIAKDNYRVCIPKDQLPPSISLLLWDRWIMLTGWCMSAVSMFVVFVIYFCLPCLATNLNPIRSHMASLCLAYTFLAVNYAFAKVDDNLACYFMAVGQQFTVLSAMCWMNVASFELWWRFRTNRMLHEKAPSRSVYLYLRIFFQNFYGWGIAAVVVVVSIILEVENSRLKPNYLFVCSVNGRDAEAVLYYGPITFCVSLNLILFILTTISLFRVRRYISLETSQIQLLCLSIKLMMVMGIPWCLEVIEWAVSTRQEYWIIVHIVTPFQGVILFYIYVNRNHVKSELKRLMVTYVTYYCCFFVAKRVATTPFRKQLGISNDSSSSAVSTETIV